MFRKLALTGSALTAATLLAAAPALARSVSVEAHYTVTPSSGAAQAMHVDDPVIDTGNWNWRAWVGCHDGARLNGGWHAHGSGLTSNTANCGSHGSVTSAGFDYRQSAPIIVGCWSPGASRNAFCAR